MAELDFDARYRVDGYEGIAFYLTRYHVTDNEVERYDPDTGEYSYENEPWEDRSRVIAVMVGDDREHIVDVDDLTPIDDDEYCSGCGQIGCKAYG